MPRKGETPLPEGVVGYVVINAGGWPLRDADGNVVMCRDRLALRDRIPVSPLTGTAEDWDPIPVVVVE